jgi:hypothetical protein
VRRNRGLVGKSPASDSGLLEESGHCRRRSRKKPGFFLPPMGITFRGDKRAAMEGNFASARPGTSAFLFVSSIVRPPFEKSRQGVIMGGPSGFGQTVRHSLGSRIGTADWSRPADR